VDGGEVQPGDCRHLARHVGAHPCQRRAHVDAGEPVGHLHVGRHQHRRRPEVDGLQTRHGIDRRLALQPGAHALHVAFGHGLVREELAVAASEPRRKIAEQSADHDRRERVGDARAGDAVQDERSQRE
jgi:hypothetical protein